MGRPPNAISLLLFLFYLGTSWETQVSRPVSFPSNATVFSHVYTIKLAGDVMEGEGATSMPQEALGPPGSSHGGGLYEHTLEGPDQEHVVFTHRINLPQQSCGCAPGTEDTRELLKRLQALENEVRTLRDTCQAGSGCCPATAPSQASTGQTDIRTLCSHHGSFDLSRCQCECEPGWGGPTCAKPACPGGCGGPQRGKCVNGHCQCRPGYRGTNCEDPPSCPDDCNDQGRCVDGRCSCFPGYVGPSCSDPACPQDCQGHGQCVSGRCVCDPGYSGLDCGTRACPSNCNRHGECRNGRCVCEPGFTGPACGTKSCPNDCNQRGRCLKGGVCACQKGYTGADCGQVACPEDCSGHGECQNGVCLCHDGYSGDNCATEIPSIGVRVSNRDETSFRLEWNRPQIPVDAYEIHMVPKKNPRAGESVRLSGTETAFERRGLTSGEEYTVTIRAEKGQRYGPPVSQTVQTRVAPPRGLRSSQVTENSVTLQWEPPASHCEGYTLSYVPVVAARPAQATKRLELPPTPETVTLEELESNTRYRITLVARQSGESSRATTIVTSTTAPPVRQPAHQYSTPSPSSHLRPGTSTHPESPNIRPGTSSTHPESSNVRPGTSSTRPEPPNVRPGTSTHPESPNVRPGTSSTRPESPNVRPGTSTHPEPPNVRPGTSTHPESPNVRPGTSSTRPESPNVRPGTSTHPEPPNVRPGTSTHPESPNVRPGTSSTRPESPNVRPGTSTHPEPPNVRPGTSTHPESPNVRPGTSSTRPESPNVRPGTSTHPEPPNVRPGTSTHPESSNVRPDTSSTHPKPPNVRPGASSTHLEPSNVRPDTSSIHPDSPNVRPGTSSTHPDSPNVRPGTSSTHPKPPEVRPDTSSTRPQPPNARPGTSSTHPESPNVRPDTSSTRPQPPNVRPDTSSTHPKLPNVRPDTSSIRPKPPNARPGTSSTYPKPPNVRPDTSSIHPDSPNVRPGTSSTHPEPPNARPGTSSTYPEPPNVRPDISSTHPEPPNVRPDISSTRPQPPDVRPDISSTRPQPPNVRPGTQPEPPNVRPGTSSTSSESSVPPDRHTTSVTKELFLKKITQNISSKLSPYNGTLLERLESYLRATNFPVQGNRTIENVARDIYIYLIRWKPKEFQDRVRERLVKETNSSFPTREFPIGETDSVYSDGYIRSDHAKPSVIASSPESMEVLLDGVRGVSENVIIRFRDMRSGEGGEVVVPGDASKAIVTGLAPGTTYQVEIHGIVKGHSSKSYSFITATAPASPTAAKTQPVLSTTRSPVVSLKDLTVTEVSPNSLYVTWSAPPRSFQGFSLQYRDPKSNATPGEIRLPGTERSVNVTGLSPRTDYELQLYGEKPNGLYEGPITSKASTAPPSAVEKPSLGGISVLEVTDNAARLSWSVATGTFDSFLIQYKDAEGKQKSLPLNGDLREAIISDLVPSRKYKFNLYGLVGRKRHGPVSTEAVTAKPEKKLTAPPGLGELSASDITSDSVHLSWSVPSGSFDSFVIQYKDAEGRPQVIPAEGDVHEVTIPSLAPSRKYRFNLYGISNRKRLGPATTDVTTAPRREEPTPEAVLGDLSVSDTTSDSVRLIWSVPLGSFDSFLIQYQDPEGNDQSLPVNQDLREATITNLAPSQRYRFNLYGISGSQHLGPVSADAVTAAKETKKERPTETISVQPTLGELSASDITSDSVLLSWTVHTGSFDSFLIQYKDAQGKTQAQTIEGGFREATISNLRPSRRYKFNLYGISGRKRSNPISTEATTASTPVSPEAERGTAIQPSLGKLSVSDVTYDSLRLSWTIHTGSFDSFLVQYKDAEGKAQALPVEGDAREVLIPSLAHSHRYKFNLFGVSGRKRSSPLTTEAMTASQESEDPTPVQPSLGELSLSDVTNHSVRLSWTIPTGSFDSFQVQYKDAGGKLQALPVKGDSREVVIPNLVASHRYKFNLYGVADRKRLGPVSIDAITASTPVSQESEEETAVQPTLGELSVSDITTNSVRLSWTIQTGSFDSFLVQYKDAKGKPQSLPAEGGAHEVIVLNLVPSRRYKFNLYGVSGRKRSGPLSIDATTAAMATSPEVTTERVTTHLSLDQLSVSDVTSNSVRLSWVVPTGDFDSFLVQYKDPQGRLQSLPVDGISRTLTVPNLEPSQRYRFNLYGVFESKRYGPLPAMAITAPASPSLPEEAGVSAPQPKLGEFSSFDISSDSLKLAWTVQSGPSFDSFLIQYKDAEGKPQALPVGTDTREVTISNLVPSHKYKFHLYGVSGTKRIESLSTEAVTAPLMEKPTPLLRLGQLTASNIMPNSLDLSWTVEEGNFDSFIIQYRDAQNKSQALPVNGNLRSLHLHDLVPSHRYQINLYGVSGRKRLGPISTEAETALLPTTPPPPPPQPTLGDLSVSDVTRNSIRLSWTVPTGSFDSFSIQYKDGEGKSQILPVEGESREITVPNLVPSRRYKFNLYGISGRKRVGPISADTVTASSPQEPPVPPSLGQLSASDITSDSVRLSWTVPTGSFDSFQVQYKDANGKPQTISVEGVFHEVIIPNLASSRRYKFNLYGFTGRKRLGPISTDAVTVSPPAETRAPPSLGQLSVSNVTSDSAHLTWTVRTGEFDSFLIQYKDAEGKPQALPLDASARETTITSLSPSRRYKFNLYGIAGRKRLGPSSADAVTASPAKIEESVQPSLGELSISDLTSNSALLSWTVLMGSFDSFLIQYKDAEGKPQSLPVEGPSRKVTVSNLAPSRRYKFNLYGLSGRKRLGPVSAEATTVEPEEKEKEEEGEERKPRLGELLVSETNSDSVRLFWSVPVGHFDSFLVQYEDGNDDVQTLTVDGDSREVTIPNLTPSQRYQFDLYGITGGETLGPISTDTFTVPLAQEQQVKETATPTPEPNLGELSVSEVTSDSVRLSWDVPRETFDSFVIQYTDAENKPQEIPVDKDTNSVIIYYLVPFYRYTFYLYGISEHRRLGPVSISIVTAITEDKKTKEETYEKAPVAMEPHLGKLTVSEVSSNAAHVTWTVPQGNFDSFSIQYKDAEGRNQAFPVAGGSRKVIIPNLVPSHKYRFNLYGISGSRRLGPISANAVTTAMTTTHDEKPQNMGEEAITEVPTETESRLGKLTVPEVTSNAARLTWSVPLGTFDSFLIQYKDAEGRSHMIPVGGGSREVLVPNLLPSHKYKFNLYGISGQQRLGPISANVLTTASVTTPDEKDHEVGEEAVKEVPRETEPRLGMLTVSEVTSDTARLTWTVLQGNFDSFSVQYKDARGTPWALPVGGDSREVVVPNLTPSHKYRFNLYGILGSRRLGPVSANAVTTAAETPGKVIEETEEETEKVLPEPSKIVQPSLGDLTVSEVTPDSLLLSWSIREGSFDSFLIQYKDAVGKLQTLPVDGAMRSLHLYNLAPSQRYKFTVFGVSGQKRLGPVSIDAVTAVQERPQEEPTVQPRLGELSVSKATSDSVSLSWSVPAGTFDSFLIQYKDVEGKPQVLPLSGSSREVTIPGLAPSRRYKFNLYGISGHKRLGPISADTITGPSTKPQNIAQLKLGELSAQDITAESLLLSWTMKSGNFDSFIIQYRDADGKPHALPVDGSLRSMKLHDLVPSHRYRFNLYGVSGRKRFGPVFTEATTAASEKAPPPRPTLGELSASDINSTSVRLSWNVLLGNFDSFIVQYRDAEGKPHALPVDRNSHEVVIYNLVPSRRYKFNLYGISGRKRLGPVSAEVVTERMAEPEIRPTLGDLFISEVTQDSVRLSWTISAGKFNSFLIQYNDANGKPQTVPVDAEARTVVISDLMNSHRYKFNLYGILGRKRIGPISTDAVTAFPDASNESATLLENLVVSEVTPTSLKLTWEVPEGEFDVFLVRCKESLLGSGRSPPPPKEVSVMGNERSAVLRGLTPNTEYGLTVYGIREGNQVANINTAARTSGLELDSPRDLWFSDIRETSVVANWRPASSRIDHYKVSFQLSDGGEPKSILVDGSKLKTIIEDLTPGASYEVTVMSLRGFEESEPLVGYVTTVPDGPSDLRAIDITDSSAVLTWHPAMAEMNNYIVTYGPVGDHPLISKQIANSPSSSTPPDGWSSPDPRVSESVPGNRVQLRVTGLRRDTEYRASVYGEKEGNRSSPISATFTTGVDGPRDLRANEISARSARLTWLPPRATPGGYLLSYETPYGQLKEISLDANITSYEIQDLVPSSSYQAQVQALRRGMPTAPTSTSFTTERLTYPFPRDCSEESLNGPGPSRVTTIYLGGNRERPLQVYCDMETDGGGWIVFQRRMNGETDFWRDWQDYATGFGNLTREFWLGNTALHQLTSSGDYELRVDLRAGNESVYANYQSFRVDSPADYYRLHLGRYSGTAGDAFSYHSGSVFSTRDRDPNRLIISCAVSYRGAWWYHNCHYANLNGLYANNRDHQGINWFNWKGFEFSIPFTEMKIRPRGFQPLRRA
ncbi:tenascin-X [Anolis sagrei]|uniref:tenascin-X n=1 Tax=Anolis sagrei TaxID=38937 RepID=UPI0035218D89